MKRKRGGRGEVGNVNGIDLLPSSFGLGNIIIATSADHYLFINTNRILTVHFTLYNQLK